MEGYELKAYERFKERAQFYRDQARHLEMELHAVRPELYRADLKIGHLEDRVAALSAENAVLRQRVEELTAAVGQGSQPQSEVPAFVKASVKRKRRRRPGRKEGHPAALRPMPDHIDAHQRVPLPVDDQGRESCPWCKSCLLEVEDRERIVEDVIPAKVIVTCYHTRSGFCPSCRKQMESRAYQQPPAANLPHGQIGINALSTAMLLRIAHRLPFRQVRQIFLDLPNFSISPAAVADQVQRVARWLEGDYQQMILKLRCAKVVYADETGWRTDGQNGWLWTVASSTDTLYHVDKSRGGKVIVDLLGQAFGGTPIVPARCSAYSKIDCKKQKCLCHLLRELVESAEKSEAFKTGPFFKQAKLLVKQMLQLKNRWEQLEEKTYTTRGCALEDKLDQLLKLNCDEPNAKRIANRMTKYRKELTAFLWDKDLAGTNNAAERALRPAVVARKISGGSRSENGAEAWATLASLIRSAGQQGQRLLDTIKAMLTAAWAAEKPPSILADSE
jgi:transposase